MAGVDKVKQLDTLDSVRKPLIWLLAFILVIYGAKLIAQLVWFVLYDASGSRVLVLPESRIERKVEDNSRIKQLSSFHLFGREGVKPVVKQEIVQDAPKTTLRLALKGVFTGEEGVAAGAIIEEIGRRNEDYYRVGSQVPGNATLEQVLDDRVLLRRNGRLETLTFDEASDVQGSIARVERRPRPEANAEISSPEAFIEEATERLAADPEKALKSVGLAVGENGGYVYQGNNPMLSGLNLEKGDVIMSVNGHNLGDLQKDKALMQSLYEQGMLEVEVVRNGASFFVNYPLR